MTHWVLHYIPQQCWEMHPPLAQVVVNSIPVADPLSNLELPSFYHLRLFDKQKHDTYSMKTENTRKWVMRTGKRHGNQGWIKRNPWVQKMFLQPLVGQGIWIWKTERRVTHLKDEGPCQHVETVEQGPRLVLLILKNAILEFLEVITTLFFNNCHGLVVERNNTIWVTTFKCIYTSLLLSQRPSIYWSLSQPLKFFTVIILFSSQFHCVWNIVFKLRVLRIWVKVFVSSSHWSKYECGVRQDALGHCVGDVGGKTTCTIGWLIPIFRSTSTTKDTSPTAICI